MYTLMRQVSPASLVWLQTPPFAAAFVIAALFHKWGSFALECIGFLATWFVLDWLYATLRGLIFRRQQRS